MHLQMMDAFQLWGTHEPRYGAYPKRWLGPRFTHIGMTPRGLTRVIPAANRPPWGRHYSAQINAPSWPWPR
jgi:hypothetical protein